MSGISFFIGHSVLEKLPVSPTGLVALFWAIYLGALLRRT